MNGPKEKYKPLIQIQFSISSFSKIFGGYPVPDMVLGAGAQKKMTKTQSD